MKRILSLILIMFIPVGFVFAGTFTFTGSDGVPVTFDIPDEYDNLINDYRSQIEDAIRDNNVTSSDLNNAKNEIENALGTSSNPRSGVASGFTEKYNTIKNGLDDFTLDLLNSVSAAQVFQNQWAQSWIGSLVPGVNFGLGVDFGVTTVSLKTIKRVFAQMGVDGINEFKTNVLPLPTANFDLRLGGYYLPFDVGFELAVLNTSKMDSLTAALGGLSFNYFSIGGDFRYALVKDMPYDFKVSVNGGFYYSKSGINYNGTNEIINSFDTTFKTITFTTGGQASVKLADFFVPYGGVRFIVSRGSLDWSVSPNWKGLLGTGTSNIDKAVSYFLPKTLSGGVKGKWIFRPQIYLGYAFDIRVVDLTSAIGYTFVSNVWSGEWSLRFALN